MTPLYNLHIKHNGEQIESFHAHGDSKTIFERGIATLQRMEPTTDGEGWEVVRQDEKFCAYAHKETDRVTDLYTLELEPRSA